MVNFLLRVVPEILLAMALSVLVNLLKKSQGRKTEF